MFLLPSGILGSVVQELSAGRVTSAPGIRGLGLHSSWKGEPSPPRAPLPALTPPFLRFAAGQRRAGRPPRGREPTCGQGRARVPLERACGAPRGAVRASPCQAQPGACGAGMQGLPESGPFPDHFRPPASAAASQRNNVRRASSRLRLRFLSKSVLARLPDDYRYFESETRVSKRKAESPSFGTGPSAVTSTRSFPGTRRAP